jgi:hypothetical protein
MLNLLFIRRACPPKPLLKRRRRGYVFLISVLAIGAISASTAISMILLGLAAQQNGDTIHESSQAWENAQTCVERALQSLRNDPAYIGNVTFTLVHGGCRLYSIGGAGNVNRVICALGTNGQSSRRLEVIVSTLYPSTLIDTWREVDTITRCR